MPDLMKEFLERTNRELADLDEKLPRLERNPADKDVWNALEKFFAGIRNTAPFLDMERSYRLSDAAFEEIMQYKDGEKGLEILPAVLMKFQRVKKIVVSVANLGREPRETDEDLLPDKKTPSLPVAQNEPEAFSKELRDKAEALKNKEKELLQQGAALDAREEELVVWSQDLSEQETFLKERENKLYDGEKRILVSENTLSQEYAKLRKTEAELDEKETDLQSREEALNERSCDAERAFADLEEKRKEEQKRFEELKEKEESLNRKENDLASLEDEISRARSDVEQMREEQDNTAEHQKMQASLLEEKERALNERAEGLKKLEERLASDIPSDKESEAALLLEIQRQSQQLAETREQVKTEAFKASSFEKELSDIREKNAVLTAQNDILKKDADENKKEAERLKSEQISLIEQHRLLNGENVELQQELARRKAAIEREREEMKKQNEAYEEMSEDLKAVRWPFDVAGLCSGLEGLAKARSVMQNLLAKSYNIQKLSSVRNMQDAALVFKGHTADLRSRSVRGICEFVRKSLKQKSEKYRRAVKIGWDIAEPLPAIDVEGEKAACRILAYLIDNSFRHAVLPKNDLVLRLKFKIRSDGSSLIFELSDNGTEVPVNTLRANIIQSNVLSRTDAEALSDDDVLQYLFHPQVRRRSDVRGLLAACAVLEFCGGRIRAQKEDGLRIVFSLPVSYLFGQALGCRIGRYKALLPLGSVVRTLSLSQETLSRNGGALFAEWEGKSVPVLPFPSAQQETSEYGIVLQAGAFYGLLRVDQILDTQEVVALHPEKTDKDTPYLIPCVTLEHGQEFSFLDVSFLIRLHPLALATAKDDVQSEALPNKTQSFLIFKSAPHSFGAVHVDDVERIDAFSDPKKDPETKAFFFESGGRKLVLKDTAPHGRFAFSKAVLILKDSALAIQEVVDILDVPVSEENETVDFVVYKGAQIPVLSEEG